MLTLDTYTSIYGSLHPGPGCNGETVGQKPVKMDFK